MPQAASSSGLPENWDVSQASSVLSSGSRNSVGLVLFLALFTNIGRELALSNICEKREKKKKKRWTYIRINTVVLLCRWTFKWTWIDALEFHDCTASQCGSFTAVAPLVLCLLRPFLLAEPPFMSVEVVVLLRWHNILVQLNDALHSLYKASAVASLFFFC